MTTPPLERGPLSIPEGATLSCPLDETGAWICTAPAAKVDVAFSVPNHAPRYLWDVLIEPGKVADVGRLEFVRGSSLAGWVVADGERDPSPGGEARLTVLQAPGAGLGVAEKLRGAKLEAHVDARGFFQITGALPGPYRLEVERDGFAPARLAVDVWDGKETVLREPIVLHRPLEARIAISPPTDPAARPWRLLVVGESSHATALFDGSAGAEGVVAVAGVTPGRYSVRVLDADGNKLSSTSHLVLDPASADIAIELSFVFVSGMVTLGDEPLQSELLFGGRYGTESIEAESDEEGAFTAVLPRTGRWRVEISSGTPELRARAIVNVDDDGELAIDLPETRLFGRVVDESGQPAARAQVHVATGLGPLAATTKSDGSFELLAVAEGTVSVSSERSIAGQRETSAHVLLVTSEDMDAGPVELRLRRMKTVVGSVHSTRGPLPGAVVEILPVYPPDAGFPTAARTDLSGVFSGEVPASTEALVMVTSPPGHALKAFDVRRGAENLTLFVPEEGGTLQVVLPYSGLEMQSSNVNLALFQDGRFLPLATLDRWARGHGESFSTEAGRRVVVRVPRIAPGSYDACLAPRSIGRPTSTPEGECVSGFLSAGGTLDLSLGAGRASEADGSPTGTVTASGRAPEDPR